LVGVGAGSVVAGPVAAAKALAKVFLYGPRFLAGEVEPTVTTGMPFRVALAERC
jgi:hypothetical protein